MSSFSLSEFFVILGLGLLGAAAILPYSFALAGDKLSQAKLPLPVLALISFLQTALLIAIATGIGLLAAQPVGLSAPYIQAILTDGSSIRAVPEDSAACDCPCGTHLRAHGAA